MAFVKAQRKRVKIKLALTGPSGSGKTYSGLEIASGLGKKVALIDTENESASLYSERFTFDTCVVSPPYTIPKYVQAIKEAIDAGYDVLVIDSLSHAWAGEGGLIDKKAKKDAAGGNSYANWNGLTQEQEKFIATILNAPIHMICTMRSKQEYVLQENVKGKMEPKKVGMAPIQRDGMEYEFTTVFDISMAHTAVASKDRTGLWGDDVFQLSKDVGVRLLTWLDGGADNGGKVAEKPEPKFDPGIDPAGVVSEPQLKRLFAISKERDWSLDQVRSYMRTAFNIESTKQLDRGLYDDLVGVIQKQTYSQAIKEVALGS